MFSLIQRASKAMVSTVTSFGGILKDSKAMASVVPSRTYGNPALEGVKFPTPFIEGDYGLGVEPFTRIEQTLLEALGQIKDKPQWWEKVNDATIRARWEKELVEGFTSFLKKPVEWTYVGISGEDDDAGREAVAKAWAASVLQEITTAAGTVMKKGGVVYTPGPVDGTWVSDNAVNDDLRKEFARLVETLENPTDRFSGMPVPLDYHPGSNKQVIDLVHPSMYPYVYDLSREVRIDEGSAEETIFGWKKTVGTGETVAPPPEKPKPRWGEVAEFSSRKFQWLPSEIDVRGVEGSSEHYQARFRSYINNLHPEDHTKLYRVIERVFAEAFVPLFNKVLTDLVAPAGRRQTVSMSEDDIYDPYVGDEDDDVAQDDYHEGRIAKVQTKLGRSYSTWEMKQMAKEGRTPESEEAKKTPTKEASAPIDLGNKRLQVIVKLANIEIPAGESYKGGSWHVEGMENEAIVASGIYYWHTDNVSGGDATAPAEAVPSVLRFRTQVQEPEYEQCDDKGVAAVFGLANEEALIQDLCGVNTTQGRCLAWPNTLQHQVQPFGPHDPTRPCSRKILVFFLVDPTKRIVSTSYVPPQQSDWALSELFSRKRQREIDEEAAPTKGAAADTLFTNRDVLEHVLGFSWHFSSENALKVREELMEERKFFTDNTMKEAYERPFSLCEH